MLNKNSKPYFLQFFREKNSPLPDKPVQSAKKKVKKLESDDEEPVSRKKYNEHSSIKPTFSFIILLILIRRRKCAVSSSSEDSEPDSAIEKPAVLKKADIFLKSVKSPTKSSKLPSSNETPLNGKLEIKKSNVSPTTKGLI